jgi:AraC-like DNA-binding protein
MERSLRVSFTPRPELGSIVRAVQYMDTPSPPEGFVVGAWPRSMLVIPVPKRYRFESQFPDQCHMYPVTIIGPHTEPIISFNEGARNRGISVEFTEVGAYQLFGVPQHELADRMLDAHAFLPAPIIQELLDAVHTSEDPSTINHGVQEALLRFVWKVRFYRIHPTVLRVLATSNLASWNRIERVAADNATTPRTLRRLFNHHIGIQPKRYFSIRRVHAVMGTILAQPSRDLSTVAYEFGFHDHAHLDHSCRRDLLISPTCLSRSVRHQEIKAVLGQG